MSRPYGRHVRRLRCMDWYLLRCPIQPPMWDEGDVETVAERELRAIDGVEAFVPCKMEWRKKSRYSRRKTRTLIPLFPGYVFVGFWTGEIPLNALYPLASRGIIHSIVATGGKPMQLRFSEIGHWLHPSRDPLFKAGEERQFMHTHREFDTGDMARIIEGAAKGQEVRIDQIKGDRARVLLGGKVPTEMPLNMLEAA